MAKRLVRLSVAVAAVLVILGAASVPILAEETAAAPAASRSIERILREVLQVLLYSALGLLVLLLSFKALDLACPFSLNKEIAEDDNTAAGVVVAGLMIAMGLIIHGALTSRF
ncbi:MAG: DUF350 domain-containing protein [Planctomycetes bacterium]|nr:DUF350 domain-containing protein [Planctomycetota bacterium]